MRRVISLFIIIGYIFSLTVGPLYALPQDAEVVSGKATFEKVNDTTLNITTSRKAIINFGSFDIAQGETVNFIQPNSRSSVLGRVIGGSLSDIFGSLTANGTLFLVNPSGIHFGAGSNIQAGSLIASTLNISNNNFLNGNYVFGSIDQTTRELTQVLNEGNILIKDGGYALLMGGAVRNAGTITANLGTVALAAGKTITVDITGDNLVSVAVDEPVSAVVLDKDGNPIANQIDNAGAITAGGGKVILTAQSTADLFRQSINLDGVVEANRVVEKNGVIEIVGSGNINVGSNARLMASGGSVKVQSLTGDAILENGSRVDVSGPDAGDVTISGNRVGLAGMILANASGLVGWGRVIIDSIGKTVMMSTSRIEARGGVVRVNQPGPEGFTGLRANTATTMYAGAVIDTMGGLDNGFVEVSGAALNVDYGIIRSGQILFDPLNITFSNAADANFTGFNPPADVTEAFADDVGLTSNFRVDGTAGSVLLGVNAGQTITFQATNDITVSNTFNLLTATGDTNVNLVLQARNNVNINSGITATGTGTITISADDDASGAGNIVMGAAGSLTTANQAMNLKAFDLAIAVGGTINSGSGSITIQRSNSGTIGLGAAVGNMSITDAEFNAFTTSGALTIGDSNTTTMTVDTLTAPATITGAMSLIANGAAGAITYSGGASTTTAGLNLTARDGVSISHNLTTGGAVTINADSNADGVGNFNANVANRSLNTANNSCTITASDIVLATGGGTSQINTGTGPLTILVSDGGTIGLGSTAGNMTIAGAELQRITATNFTLGDNTNGNITVNNITAANSNNIAGTLTLNATGAANTVTFATTASTFNALAVNAGAGINANINVTTDTGGFTANADSDTSGGGSFSIANGATVSTAGVNQPINITAADMVLTGTGALAAGSGAVTLKPSTAGATIGIADAAKNFSLTDTELDQITTTGLLTVGVSTNTGGITIGTDAALTQAAKNFSFITGGNVAVAGNNFTTTGNVTLSADADTTGTGAISTGAGVIAANTLTTSAAQGIALNTAVTTLSATNTTSGNVAITETDGVSASGSNTGGGSFSVTAGGAGSLLTVNAGNINSNGGNITLTADDMTITGTVNAGAGITTLKQNSAARNIDLGTNTAGTLGLTDTELDRVTASVLRIGNTANTGNINVSAAISAPAGYNTLSLLTGGNIAQTAGLVVSSLAIQSVGSATLTNATNNVATLAANITGVGISYRDNDSLTVGTVDGVIGITAAGGSATLTTGSTLTVNQAVNASGGAGNGSVTFDTGGAITLGANVLAGATTGTVTLNPTTGGATQNAGSITGQNLLLTGTGTFALSQTTNDVANIAANVTGAVTYKDANALTITTVGATNGITTNSNAIDISTVNGTLTVNDTAAATDVNAGTSTVTLAAGSSGNDNALTINSSASVAGSGSVTLVADNMTIGATANISSGAGITTVRPYESGTLINLGGADAPGTLGLTSAEINRITASILRVGSLTSGNLSISAVINPTGTNTLSLLSGGTMLQTNSLTVTNLALQSVGTISLTSAANNVTNVASNVTGQTNSFTYRDIDSMTVGTVDGIVGINTADVTTTGVTSGFVTLTSAGAITLTNDIKTGNTSSTFSSNFVTNASGDINLTAATGINGTGHATTGYAEFTGPAQGGGTGVRSGSINASVTGAGDIALSAADALTIGRATMNMNVGSNSATTGNIVLSADRVNNGAVGSPLDVSFGSATGAFSNTAGTLGATTDGGAGSAGEIQITSGEALTLGALTTGAGAQTVNVATTGTANLTVNDAAESISGDNVSLTTATGTLQIKDTSFDVGSGSLTLTADGTVNLSGGAGSIKGTGGTVTIQPASVGTTIGIGGAAGILQLSAATITALQNGFNSITIGRSNGTGLMTVNAITFNDPVTLRSPSGAGAITVNGQITGSDNASVTLSPGTGGINLNAGIITSGNAVALNGNVVLGSNVTIDTEQGNIGNGGSVNITGSVSGNAAGRDLTIDTSTSAVASNGGAVTLSNFNNAGGSYLHDLSILTGGTASAGQVTLTGASILLNSSSFFVPGSFSVTGGGNIVLNTSVTIDTDQGNSGYGGSVNFGTSAISGNAAGRDLTIDTHTGAAPAPGGAVTLAGFNNAGGAYLNDVSITTWGNSASSGTVTLTNSAINLDDNGAADPASFQVTMNWLGGSSGNLVLNNNVTIDTEQGNNGPGGLVSFDNGTHISGNAAGRDLTINTATTNAGSNGGAVTLPVFDNGGGAYIHDLSITTSAGAGGTAGVLTLGGNISLDDNGIGVASSMFLVGGGDVIVSSSLTIDTEQGNTPGVDGGTVNLDSSNVYANAAGYALGINTATTAAGRTGGAVTLGLVDDNAGANNYLSSLSIDASAATNGAISLQAVTTTGTQSYNGASTLNGNLATTNSNITLSGSTTLATGLAINAGSAALVNNGTLADGGFTAIVRSDITNNGTHTGTGRILLSLGSAVHTLSGAGSYTNLELFDANGAILGSDLTVGGTLTITNGNFDANGYKDTVTGLASINGGSYTASTGTQAFDGGLTIAGGTFTGGTGAVDVTDVTINSGSLIAPSGLFTVSGNWQRTGGTFTPGANTVTFDKNAGTQTLDSGGISFGNIVHSGAGILQLTSNLATTGGGTFENSSGTFDANSRTATIAGLATVSGGEYKASSALQTFNGGLTISGGTFTSGSGDVDVNGNVMISSGTLTAPATNLFVSGDWTHTAGGTFDANGGTVIFDGNASTIDVASTENFNRLTVNKNNAQTLTIAAGDTLITPGLLTLTNGKVDGGTLEVQGDVTVQGGFDGGTTPLRFTAGAVQSFDSGGAGNFDGNVSIFKTGGQVNLTSDLIMDFAGQDLTVTARTLNLGNNNLTVAGLLTINGGTVTHGAGSVNLNDYSETSGTFSGGSGAVNFDGSVTASGGLFTATSGTTSAKGDWDISGTTFSANGGTVLFDGTAAQDITSGTAIYNNLTVANGSGIVTFQDAFTTNNFTDITPSSQLTFHAGDTYTINGLLNINGQALGTRITIRSTDTSGLPSARYTFDVTSQEQVVSYINVRDSNTASHNINASYIDSVNTGNNDDTDPAPHWVFSTGGLWYWIGAGNTDWDNVSNWSLISGGFSSSGYPIAGDRAIFDIGGSGTCTLDANASLNILDLQSTYLGIGINLNGFDMTVGSTVDIASGTLTAPAGSDLTVGGNFTIEGGTLNAINANSLGVGGDMIISSGLLSAPASGLFTVSGNWTNTAGLGSFSDNNGTVEFNGAGTQLITSDGEDFYDIYHSGVTGTFLQQDNLNVLNTLENAAGNFNANGFDVAVAGLTTVSGGTYFAGTGANNLNGGLTVSSGNFDGESADIDTTHVVIGAAGALTAPDSTGSFLVSGGWTNNLGGSFDASSGTVTFDGVTQNIDNTSGGNFFKIALSSSTSATLLSDLDANSTLDLTSGTFYTNGFDVTATGLATVSGGTFTADSGTHTFDGGLTVSSGIFDGQTSSVNVTNVTIGALGTLTAPDATSTFLVSGNWTNNSGGTFNHSGGTVTFDGSTQTLDNTSGGNFYDLVASSTTSITLLSDIGTNNFTQTSGNFFTNGFDLTAGGSADIQGGVFHVDTGTQTFNFGLTVSGGTVDGDTGTIAATDVTISSGTLTAPNATGAFTVSGAWLNTAGVGSFNDNGGTVTFTSAGVQDLTSGGESFYNITHNGTGRLELQDALSVLGTLKTQAGSFDGSTNNVSIDTVNVDLANGSLDPSTSALFTVSGDWTRTLGSFNDNAGTVTFDGTGTQTITSGGESFYNLTHSGSGTLQLADQLRVTTTLENQAGTFDSQDQILDTFNVTLSGGDFIAPSSSSFTVQGDWTNTAGAGSFDDNGGTVTFTSAGVQDLTSGGESFYNITHNGTGRLELQDSLSVLNTLKTQAGSFDAGTNNVSIDTVNVDLTNGSLDAPVSALFTVSGDWTRTLGSFNDGAGTVTFDGTGTQTLTSGGDSFFNLTHSGSGTLQLADDLKVNNTLENQAGTFDSQDQDLDTFYVTLSGGDFIAPSSGIFTVLGDWTNTAGAGSFSDNGGTVTFTSAAVQKLTSGGEDFYNITDNGNGRLELQDSLSVLGTLKTQAGTFDAYTNDVAVDTVNVLVAGGFLDAPSSALFTVSGDWTIAVTGFHNNNGTVTFDGAGTQSLTSDGEDFYNLTHSGSGTLQLADDLKVTNILENQAGTFDSQDQDLDTYHVTFSGGNFIAPSTGTFTVQGDWTNTAGAGSFDDNGGTVTLNGFTLQTITAGGEDFANLLVTNASALGVKFADGFSATTFTDTTASSLLTFNAGSTYTFTGGAGALNLNGGAVGTRVTLRSSAPGTRFNFDVTGSDQAVDYVDVQDSNALTNYIVANRSVGVNTNNHWIFSLGNVRYWILGVGVGAWNAAANWSTISGGVGGASAPIAGDTAIFDGNGAGNSNLTAAGTGIDILQLQGATDPHGAYAGILDANGFDMTVSGLATISGGTYQAGSATQTFNGGLTISGGTFTGGSGIVDVNGDLALSSGTLNAPSNDLTVSGDWNNTGGTFNSGSSNGYIVILGGAGTQDVTTSGYSFFDLRHSGAGTLSLQDTLNVSRNLTNSAGIFNSNDNAIIITDFNSSGGTFNAPATNTFSIAGGCDLTGGTFNAAGGTVTFNGSGDLNTAGQAFDNVIMSGSVNLNTNPLTVNGTLQLNAGAYLNTSSLGVTVTGLATIAGGTYGAGSGIHTFNGGLTVSGGTFDGSVAGTVDVTDVTLSSGVLTASSAGSFLVSGNWTVTGGTFDPNGGIVTFDGAGTQTLDSGNQAFYSIDHTGTSLLQLTGNPLVLNGALTNSLGAGNFDANTQAVTAAGLTTVAGGTYLASTGIQIFDGGLTVSGGTFTGSTGTVDVTDVVLSSGVLTAPSALGAFLVSGNWSKTGGTFNHSNATVNFDGAAGTQTLDSGGTAVGSRFYNLTHSGAGTLQLTGNNLRLQNNFTNSAGTFDNNGLNITILGNWNGSGGIFNPVNGTVTFTATAGNQNVTTGAGNSFYNLTHNDAGTLKLQDDLVVTNNLTNSAGTLNNNTHDITVGHNWNGTGGIFTPANGTVYFNGASGIQNLTSGAGNTFRNINHSGAGTLRLQDNLTVTSDMFNSAGTLDNNGYDITVSRDWNGTGGTFNPINGTVFFDRAAGAQDLTSGVGNSFFDLQHTGAGSLRPQDTLTVTNTLTNTNGTFNANVADPTLDIVNFSLTGGTFEASDTGSFLVSGNWSKTGGTFSHNNGTVTFDGALGTQTLDTGGTVVGSRFYNLVHDNTGTLQLVTNNLRVQNDLTNSSGTLDNNNLDITVLGNWNGTGGTFVPINGVVIFDGVGVQNLTSGAGNNFFTLRHTGAGTVMLQDGLTVNDNLRNAVGTFDANDQSIDAVDVILAGGIFQAPATSNFLVSGNWNNMVGAGAFVNNGGAVTLDGAALQTITSSGDAFGDLIVTNASLAGVRFADGFTATNFTDITPSSLLTFNAGSTYTISGALNLNGGAIGTLIQLRSSAPGTQWNIDPQGTRTVDYVDAQDSNNINATLLQATHSKDSGNNTNWYLVDHFTITGTTPMTAGASNALTITAIDGVGGASTSYTGDWNHTFSGASSIGVYDPTVSDKTATDIIFGNATTLTFTSGVATAGGTMKLYRAETANIATTDGIATTPAPFAVTVDPAAPNYLTFGQQPTTVQPGAIITPAVTVETRDTYGNLCTNDSATAITMAIGFNPSGGTLGGTLLQTVTSGVATFGDLTIDQAGSGYTLAATALGLTGATSSAFNVMVPPPPVAGGLPGGLSVEEATNVLWQYDFYDAWFTQYFEQMSLRDFLIYIMKHKKAPKKFNSRQISFPEINFEVTEDTLADQAALQESGRSLFF